MTTHVGHTHAHHTQHATMQALRDKGLHKVEIQKSNLLLFGPTGCGKTLLAKSLARFLHVPFVIVDATSLTQAGYVGDDVETILTKLLIQAGGNVAKAERGIVYIDEIDKIATRGPTQSIARDVAGEGVQQALLKLLEGSVVSVSDKLGKRDARSEMVSIDTTNILFIAGGAFTGLDRFIANRLNRRSMGFENTINEKLDKRSHKDHSHLLVHAEPRDMIEFGLIPEFVGRFPVFVPVAELTIAQLVQVLTEPKNALWRQYEAMFLMNNVSLDISQDAFELIAKLAHDMGTGARGLRTILERTLHEAMFDLTDDTEHRVVHVTREMVLHGQRLANYALKAEATANSEASASG